MNHNNKWKTRIKFCKSCKTNTNHAYDSSSQKGELTKIFICRNCEDTTITKKYKNRKFVLKNNY